MKGVRRLGGVGEKGEQGVAKTYKVTKEKTLSSLPSENHFSKSLVRLQFVK